MNQPNLTPRNLSAAVRIRLDDIEFLFPETVSWREIRNLLLIAIFEKLHDNLINVQTQIEEQEEIETPENE